MQHYRVAVSLGGGHGGCEAFLVGVALLIALISLSILRQKDLDKILPPEEVPEIKKVLDDYWTTPWYDVLMAPVERVTAMIFHMSAAVLVLQVFRRNEFAWLGAAIGFHALVDTVAVIAIGENWNKGAAEIILASFTIPLAVWILVALADNTDTGADSEYALLLPSDADQDAPEVTDADERDTTSLLPFVEEECIATPPPATSGMRTDCAPKNCNTDTTKQGNGVEEKEKREVDRTESSHALV